jgi:hypothetical protein
MKSDYDIQQEKEGEIICRCFVIILAVAIVYGLYRVVIEIIGLLRLLGE